MIVQIKDNKIVALPLTNDLLGKEGIFKIDAEILPKTEEGELDYEAIFALEVEVKNNEVKIK